MRELRTPDDLDAIAGEWTELARAASEPNPYFEPWLAIPALRHLVGTSNVRWLAVKDSRLLGVVPIERTPPSRAMPLPRWRIWRHPYCFLCTPLVRAGDEDRFWRAVLDWLAGRSRVAAPLELPWLSEGPVLDALVRELDRRNKPTVVARQWQRALLAPAGGNAADYAAQTIRKKKRKELRRQRSRLADTGSVELRTLGIGGDQVDDEALRAFADRFCALETAGWKGAEGTAMASRAGDRRFLEECLIRGHRAGALSTLELSVDGQAIASKIVFAGGRTGFMFKIAFDEAYARYSPGVLLELDFLELAIDGGHFETVDSCAAPDHPMIDHLWAQRRPLRSLTVGAGPAGMLWLRARPLLSRLRRWRRAS